MHVLIPLLVVNLVLAVVLAWMWLSGWARNDRRCYGKMQRSYTERNTPWPR